MDQPPPGIQAKIDRADEHFRALDALVGAYLHSDPYRVVGEERVDKAQWHYDVFLEVDSYPPDEVWGPIIGDVVHNLRSALDHLAWQLALPIARSEHPRKIAFPIFLILPKRDDPASSKRAKDLARMLCHLRPDCHAAIEAVQPGVDAIHPLWLLHALWNTDKHRTLHTTGFILGKPTDRTDAMGFSSYSWGPFDRAEPQRRTRLGGGRMSLQAGFDRERALADKVADFQGEAADVCVGSAGRGEHWWTESPFAGLPARQMLRKIREFIVADVMPPLVKILDK